MLESMKPCMISKVSKELPNYLSQHINDTYQQSDYEGNIPWGILQSFQSFLTDQRNNCNPPLKDVTGCDVRLMPMSSTESSFINMNMPTSAQGQENPYSVVCQNQKFLVQDPGGYMISGAYQAPYTCSQILDDVPPPECYTNSNVEPKLSASRDYTISLKFPRSAENCTHISLHQNSSLVVDNLGGSSKLDPTLQHPSQVWWQPHARRNMTNVKMENDIDCSTLKGFHNPLHPELHTPISKHFNTGYASNPMLGSLACGEAFSPGNASVDNVAKLNQSRCSYTRRKIARSSICNFLVQYSHTLSCSDQSKTCFQPSCLKMKTMLSHMKACNIKCACSIYRKVLLHFKNCSNGACNICSPVWKILSSSQLYNSGTVDPNGCCYLRTKNDSDVEIRTQYTDKPLIPLDNQLASSEKQFPDMPEDPAANNQMYLSKRPFTDMVSDPSLDDQTNTFKRQKTKDELNPCSRDKVLSVSPVDPNNYSDFSNSMVEPTVQNAVVEILESSKISRPCAIELTSIGPTDVLTFETQSSIPLGIKKRILEEIMQVPIEANNKDVELKSTATQSYVHSFETIDHTQILTFDSQSVKPPQIENRTPEESVRVLIEVNNKDVEPKCTVRPSDAHASEAKFVCLDNKNNSDIQVRPTPLTENAGHFARQNRQHHIEVEKTLLEFKHDVAEKGAFETTLGKKKIRGLSLIQWFTPHQVEEHLRSVKQMADQLKSNDGKNKQMQVQFDENTCQLCGTSSLYFDAPAIFCHLCVRPIKCGAAYNTATVGDTFAIGVGTEICLCTTCCNKNAIIKCAGNTIPKTKLKKKINDERDAEPWVQCDKCSAWQHQICSLFNDIQNDRDTPEYTCPICYLDELENGECMPLPKNTLLCARNLPKSKLSDHIETRLFMRLKQEREERANKQGMHFDEVPGAESLVVRVISSTNKKLEVKKLFHGIFEGACYPKDFPYKSKAILLFQNIGGADICIFAMYVQEYGSDCPPPNQRHVYLAYLDSVQHFSPEIKAVTGEALRTYVYHEILIGYLDYCKKRGFTCCYIWSCPSLKQEDFILNCHPRKQKMPNDIKLRKWYRTMLKKATKENIVVHTTNLYDYFFMPSSECKARETAARLPYFDGDFWPGMAEEVLCDLKRDGGESKKKLTKRADKAFKQNPFNNTYKDLHLMDKIGDSVHQKKENFILVHLQHACNHCYEFIVTGNRWICNSCEKFQLCDRCHEKEEALDDKMKHCINKREEHKFLPVEIIGCPLETTDLDDTVHSEVFDCRLSFLNFCQARHYQFDTLRHAKHSTMMLLYQHYNTATPAITMSCSQLRDEIPKTAKTLDLEVHPGHQISGHISHTSKCVIREVVDEGRDVLGEDVKSEPFQKKDLLNLFSFLRHASECTGVGCSYTACRRLKLLFRHCKMCKTRLSGGCRGCNTVWWLLKFHARSCDKSDCRVPRCMDIKHHIQQANKKLSPQSNNAEKT